jgi:hypothetical protein
VLQHPLRSIRRLAAVAAAALLPLLGACGERRPVPDPSASFAAELARAEAYADSLVAVQRAEGAKLKDEEVIALGYLERLRMGLGSPFRLIDHAVQDPRLSPEARRRTGAVLLAKTRAGEAYAVDPLALSTLPVHAERSPAAARLHRDLIERAVANAADPAEAELALRAAYTLAAAEQTVAPHAPALAARAAALARDRALARRDARALVAEAARTGRHPLALLREWRAARRFRVEAPAPTPRGAALELRAAAAAPALAQGIAAIPARASVESSAEGEAPASLLGRATARRLSVLASRHEPPPLAPLAVTLDRYDVELRRAVRGSAPAREAAERLLEEGRDEEHFVVEHARLARAHPAPVVAALALEAAVTLRTHNQEAVWHRGFPAPTVADLKRRYGLAAVDFDADVPLAWRPYYRRMLDDALADLELVLPSLDLQGLAVQFGRTGKEGAAVAVHDPHGRRIHLPPATGAGAIMHEIAHDLDWQVARRRFGRGGYGTDLALQAPDADAFTAAVRALPVAPVPDLKGSLEARRRYESRPTETFARLLDGYVTATLAARGRSNGYLSSYQDEVLSGHGTAVAPDARGRLGAAFLPLLMEASPLPSGARSEFGRLWGPRQAPGPLALVGEAVAAGGEGPAGRPGGSYSVVDRARLSDKARERIAQVERRRDELLADRAEALCRNPFLSLGPAGEARVERLVRHAARLKVRGIVRQEARAMGVGADPARLEAAWLDGDGPAALVLAPPAGAAGGCGAGE